MIKRIATFKNQNKEFIMSNIALLTYKEILTSIAEGHHNCDGERRPSYSVIKIIAEIYDVPPLTIDTDIDNYKNNYKNNHNQY